MSEFMPFTARLHGFSADIDLSGIMREEEDDGAHPHAMEVLPARAHVMVSAYQDAGHEGPAAITVPSSAPYYVKALDSGRVWTNDGSGVVITYKFWDSLPSAYSASSAEARNFQTFTAQQKVAALADLAMIASYTNVTFVEAGAGSNPDIGFANANLGAGVGGWTYYPGSGKGGDVWINNYYSSYTKNVDPGTYGAFVLAHEIGHAMGLKHPFEGTNVLKGAEDSSRWTILSYTWPFYAESYMIYDIAALQAKYGVNMNHATGDDNYVLKYGSAYAIWDAGGTDTLDGSEITASMTLNLNAGTMSSVGKVQNIGIAFNVTIENVKGGAGADIIHGNNAANHIWGNGGNDTIYGSAGNDIIDGGSGTDRIIYIYNIGDFLISLIDSVTVTLTHSLLGLHTLLNIENFTFGSITYGFGDLRNQQPGGGENPDDGGNNGGGQTAGVTLNGTSGANTLTGGAGDDVINGNGGYDKMYGGAGNDRIFGGSYMDKLYGEDGDDVLYGYGSYDTLESGAGNDTLYGGDYYDKLYGGAGNDDLHGDEGNDYLYGGDGNDILRGGAGNDTMYGDGGNDVLMIGEGRDSVYGKAGSDVFHFAMVDSQADYIRDFTLTGVNGDKLNITDILSGFDNGDDIGDFVQLAATASRLDVLINQDGAGNDWIKAASLTGSNFSGVTLADMIEKGQLIVDANPAIM